MGLVSSFPSRLAGLVVAALILSACQPSFGGWLNKNQPLRQWAVDASKTKTPGYANDAAAVILFDEYVETIDAQGRAVEREREAIRILKPQGRGNTCQVSYDESQKINYFRVWTIAADEKQYQSQDTDFTEQGDTSVPIMLSTRKSRIAHPPASPASPIPPLPMSVPLSSVNPKNSWNPTSKRRFGASSPEFLSSSRLLKSTCLRATLTPIHGTITNP
jgi:Domain of Unknown Function with PDB structure (DUF3857)